MPAKKLQTETLRHQKAFEYYYSLGEKRSSQAVATEYAISHAAAKKWTTSFRWLDRVVERDEIIANAVAKAATNETIKDRKKILDTCQMIMADFAKRAHPDYKGENKVVITTGIDYERMEKLYLLLIGEVTDRVENLEVIFSSGADGEDWTKRDAEINKPNIKDRENSQSENGEQVKA